MIWAARFCAFLSVLLGIAAVYFYVTEVPEPMHGVTIVATSIDMGEQPIDKVVEVSFQMRNDSSQPCRIIGMNPG